MRRPEPFKRSEKIVFGVVLGVLALAGIGALLPEESAADKAAHKAAQTEKAKWLADANKAADDAVAAAKPTVAPAPAAVVGPTVYAWCETLYKNAAEYDMFGKSRDIVLRVGNGTDNLGDSSDLRTLSDALAGLLKSSTAKSCKRENASLYDTFKAGEVSAVLVDSVGGYMSHAQLSNAASNLRDADKLADQVFYGLHIG